MRGDFFKHPPPQLVKSLSTYQHAFSVDDRAASQGLLSRFFDYLVAPAGARRQIRTPQTASIRARNERRELLHAIPFRESFQTSTRGGDVAGTMLWWKGIQDQAAANRDLRRVRTQNKSVAQ